MHIRPRARAYVREVHRRGGRQRVGERAGGNGSRRWLPGERVRVRRTETATDGVACTSGGRERASIKSALPVGVASVECKACRAPPQRRRRFLLININTLTHAQTDRRVVVTAVRPEPPPCAFVCLLVRVFYVYLRVRLCIQHSTYYVHT